MNYKQSLDGFIQASFRPEELLALVHLVKGAEQLRLDGLKEEAEKNLLIASEAEKEALDLSATPKGK